MNERAGFVRIGGRWSPMLFSTQFLNNASSREQKVALGPTKARVFSVGRDCAIVDAWL